MDGTPARDGGLQAERTHLAGVRTALSMAAATPALAHVADVPRAVTAALLPVTASVVVITASSRWRDARGPRLAALSSLGLLVAACAFAVIATG